MIWGGGIPLQELTRGTWNLHFCAPLQFNKQAASCWEDDEQVNFDVYVLLLMRA